MHYLPYLLLSRTFWPYLFCTIRLTSHFYAISLEAFARISVSGLLLDPEVPVSSLFTSLFASSPDMPHSTSAMSAVSLNSSHHSRQTTKSRSPFSRGLSIRQRLHVLQANAKRPFALPNTRRPPLQPRESTSFDSVSNQFRSDTFANLPAAEKASSMPHDHVRNASHADFLSLPFKLSVATIRDKTQRNMPYLRHSWNRIDLLALIGFWVSFALATGGIERGSKHIGIFRALSVFRTARLLTITSGTTVRVYSCTKETS